MKYEDLGDEYLSRIDEETGTYKSKWGDWKLGDRSPLDIILPTPNGIRFMWMCEKVLVEDSDEVSDYEFLEKGWVVVSHDTFPKLPLDRGRIGWRGLVLCSNSLPSVQQFVEDHEKEVMEICARRAEFSESLEAAINRRVKERVRSVVKAMVDGITDKIRIYQDFEEDDDDW